jgi:YVTN family beta-propeller protein
MFSTVVRLLVATAALFCVLPLRAGEKSPAPTQVYVVNTLDASVSLVDLVSMKEVKRFKVGSRPYGIAVCQHGKTVAVGVEDEEAVKFFDAADFSL